MPGRMAGTMDHLELKLTNLVDPSVLPIFIGFRRLLVIEPVLGPLRTRDTDPRGLLGKFVVDPFVRLVNDDLRFGL